MFHVLGGSLRWFCLFFFFFQAEDGIRDYKVTGVQTCALPILRGRPTLALGVRDHVQCQRGLTARFGAEDLRYPPPRDAADPDRRVQVDRARRDDLHPHPRRIGPHPHDGALAASLLDLRDGEVEGLSALVRELRDFLFRRHECPRHGLGASFGEARIYPEAPVIATRGGTRRPGAPACRPRSRCSRTDRCPAASRSGPPRPAPPSRARAASRPSPPRAGSRRPCPAESSPPRRSPSRPAARSGRSPYALPETDARRSCIPATEGTGSPAPPRRSRAGGARRSTATGRSAGRSSQGNSNCPLDGGVTELLPTVPFSRGNQMRGRRDRKSTRLNSSHLVISYAVFCLKKKK